MSVQKLFEAKVGDTVAFKPFYSDRWGKTRVMAVTGRCIVVECEPDKKFWKNSGMATDKEYPDDKISVVTPEIQEQWDKSDNCISLSALRLEDYRDKLPVNTLKEILTALVAAGEWSKLDYAIIIHTILEECDLTSSSLKQAVAILHKQLPPKK